MTQQFKIPAPDAPSEESVYGPRSRGSSTADAAGLIRHNTQEYTMTTNGTSAGLPVEWVHIGTGAAYTLTSLSNLHSENREQWPVMAHYTGADGKRWTCTLASFVGSMRAGNGRPMGTESVPVEPEESPAVPEPDVAEATSGKRWGLRLP